MSGRSAWRAVLAAWVCGVALAGCVYGYSRDALEYGAALPPPPPRGYAGVGYEAGWASPWYFSFSYTYGYPYYPYSMYYYDPWWYYPPRYAYPWYPYPYRYVPFVVTPAPRRTFRSDPGTSPAPSPPAGKSKRRFDLP